MDYLDMLKDLATTEGEVEPQEAKSILNGARDRLGELESKVQERLPDDSGETAAPSQKSRSDFSRKERAEFYAEQREKGRDPHAEWKKLPE